MSENRTISDEDAEAIANALEQRLAKRFYINLGQGVWGLAWKAVVAAVVLISAYGAVKGHA